MRRLICRFRGHTPVRVTRVGVTPRPGGMLPSLDGYVTYAPDPAGQDQACTRCAEVLT